MSGDISDGHGRESGPGPGTQRVEAGPAAKHPAVHRAAPPPQRIKYLAPPVNRAVVKEAGLKG